MTVLKELTFMLLLCGFLVADAKEIPHKHRHSALAVEVEILKKQHHDEIQALRHEMTSFKKQILEQCVVHHRIRHGGTTEERRERHSLIWTRKAVHELRGEIKEVAKAVNTSGIMHQIHNMQTHMKRVVTDNAEIQNLGRNLETRVDKMDGVLEQIKYENKNMEIAMGEMREELSTVVKQVKHKIVEEEELVNDMVELNSAQAVSAPLQSEKSHKCRHNKMVHAQISRLSEAQAQLDVNQKSLANQVHGHKLRLDRLEEPNLDLMSAKIDLLELESKVFSDRLNNNTRTVADFEKVHASMLELRENLEAVENKMDQTIPEFRKEISKLDVSQAQMNAHFSYVKEDQDNLRQSVKAIAVSMSNAQDRAEKEREELKKINNSVTNLTAQAKKHYYRLNDHILKSEANVIIPEANLTETISLPELMGEVKELQPVEHEYEDLVAQLPKDCTGISGPVGPYLIRPGSETIDAWCVNGTTLAQRRYNGSEEFNRKFAEYVRGFGNPASEYWIGLETMHQLTKDNCTSMRIDMTDIYGVLWYAQYENFYVGNADTGYVLNVTGFSGNASDAFEYQNHMEFSAIDKDRDISNSNCAANYEGGWWFSHCQHVNINGKYTLGLTWFDSTHNEWIAVSTSEMRMFRRPGCF